MVKPKKLNLVMVRPSSPRCQTCNNYLSYEQTKSKDFSMVNYSSAKKGDVREYTCNRCGAMYNLEVE